MQVAVYHIPGMDCPSEENIIRLAFQDLETIHKLDFNIPERRLKVYHSTDVSTITKKLEGLNFGATLVDVQHTVSLSIDVKEETIQRRLLLQVLGINAFFFIAETIAGVISRSMGLLADGLDMLADALVYGMSLYVIGKSASSKKKIALLSGYGQVLLALVGLTETVKRFVGFDQTPDYRMMIIVSIFALFGNALCLWLLQKSKSKEAHMQASIIFTSNDVLVNLGVLVAGAVVLFTGKVWPDLIIGTLVFLLVLKGAFAIISLGRAKA
ncbi:MAG: cation transporter [Chryseotalea sp.]